MNKSIVISVMLLVLIGVGVSRIKYEVVFLRKNLKTLTSEIEKRTDNIKVLEAEWSYLNNPERLKKLANKYLPEMKPVGVKQVMVYNKIICSDLVATETEAPRNTKDDGNNKVKVDAPPRTGAAFEAILDKAVGGD